MEQRLPQTDPVEKLPILILYPHNRCNCRCVMCDIWRVERGQDIAVDHLRGWINSWRNFGVRRIVLSGGEALMHRECTTFMQALHEAGFAQTLLSTGILLNRYAIEVSRYCDSVVLSLDGPREIHDEIRQIKNAYDKLYRGVQALRDQGIQLEITARCTVQRANYQHLRATVQAAIELGLDSISFLAVDASSEAFNRPGGWSADRSAGVSLNASELAALEQELTELEREYADAFASGFIVESPEKLNRRLLQHFGACLGNGAFPEPKCNAPWVSAVVETDGLVRPCFFHAPYGKLEAHMDLNQVVNSPAALEFRRRLDVSKDAVCRRCVCSLSLREGEETLV